MVKGAVLRGMGIGMSIPSKLNSCPRHYGVCVSDAYAEYKQDAENVVIDRFSGLPVIPSRLFWLIRKGDVILPEVPITCSFNVTSRFLSKHPDSGGKVRITFISTALDNTPTILPNLPRGTTINFPFPLN